MSEIMEEVGGDGFLVTDRIHPPLHLRNFRRSGPGLQKLGVVRKHYEHLKLRENLRAF